jgi:hypothetical protein
MEFKGGDEIMNINSTRAIRYATIGVLALAFIITLSTLAPTAEGQEKFKETYTAVAVNMGTSNPPIIPLGVRATVQINVTRWSTDEEREYLFTELLENGAEGLVKALQKQEETGWIRNTSSTQNRNTFPSERLRYSHQFKQNGKRRIILALDRPISFAEAVYRPRWRDYDVTLVVLDVDDEGKGEGQLAMGVKLEIDTEKKALVIENFGSEPVRLMSVRLSK